MPVYSTETLAFAFSFVLSPFYNSCPKNVTVAGWKSKKTIEPVAILPLSRWLQVTMWHCATKWVVADKLWR